MLYKTVIKLRSFFEGSIITSFTGFVCKPTAFRASGRLCRVLYKTVIKLRSFFEGSIITSFTGFVCKPTAFRASGRLCWVLYKGVTRRYGDLIS